MGKLAHAALVAAWEHLPKEDDELLGRGGQARSPPAEAELSLSFGPSMVDIP